MFVGFLFVYKMHSRLQRVTANSLMACHDVVPPCETQPVPVAQMHALLLGTMSPYHQIQLFYSVFYTAFFEVPALTCRQQSAGKHRRRLRHHSARELLNSPYAYSDSFSDPLSVPLMFCFIS